MAIMLKMNKCRVFVFLAVLACSIVIGIRVAIVMQQYFDRKKEANGVWRERFECADENAWMQKQEVGCWSVDLFELKQPEFCILNTRCLKCSECLYFGAIRDILECGGSVGGAYELNEYEVKDLSILRDELRFGLCMSTGNGLNDRVMSKLAEADLSIAAHRELFGFYRSMSDCNLYHDERVEEIVRECWPERIEYANCSLCVKDGGLKRIVNLKSYVVYVISRYVARCNAERDKWDACIVNVLANMKESMEVCRRRDALRISRVNVNEGMSGVHHDMDTGEEHEDEYMKKDYMRHVGVGDVLRSFFFFLYYGDVVNDDELFGEEERMFLSEKCRREFSGWVSSRLDAFKNTDLSEYVQKNDIEWVVEHKMIEEIMSVFGSMQLSDDFVNGSENAIEKHYTRAMLRIVDESRLCDVLDMHERELVAKELRRVAMKRCRSMMAHLCEKIDWMKNRMDRAVRMSVTMGKYMWKINEGLHELEHAEEVPDVNRRRIVGLRTKLEYVLKCIACYGKAEVSDVCTRAIARLLGLQSGGFDGVYEKSMAEENVIMLVLRKIFLSDRKTAHANAMEGNVSMELWRYAGAVLMRYFDECEAEEKTDRSLRIFSLSSMSNLIDVVGEDGVSVVDEYIEMVRLMITDVMCDELKHRLKYAISRGTRDCVFLKHALDKRRKMVCRMISKALLVCDSSMEGLVDVPGGLVKMMRKVLGKDALFAERMAAGIRCRMDSLVLLKMRSKYGGVRCLFRNHEFRLADVISRAVAEFVEAEPKMTEQLLDGMAGR